MIARSDVLLCHDSGPMHLAAAAGTPTVVLCGSTNPMRTGPYPPSNPSCVIRAPGMMNISVGTVIEALEEILWRAPERHGPSFMAG